MDLDRENLLEGVLENLPGDLRKYPLGGVLETFLEGVLEALLGGVLETLLWGVLETLLGGVLETLLGGVLDLFFLGGRILNCLNLPGKGLTDCL